MGSLLDTPLDVGNADRVTKQLEENSATVAAAAGTTTGKKEEGDPRFRGKSSDDVIDMYRNLESHTGRLANELGQLRRTTDQILLSKRADDLRQNGATSVISIKPTDLLERPTEALGTYFDSRVAELREPLEQRINSLEVELAATRLNSTHSDANAVANSAKFQEWVKGSPLRQQVANLAAQGNIRATTDLITEFKLAGRHDEGQQTREQALAAAEKVALEQGRTGADGGPSTKATGKTYRRADLIALRMSNPDRYEEPGFAAEILKAYREGRVV